MKSLELSEKIVELSSYLVINHAMKYEMLFGLNLSKMA